MKKYHLWFFHKCFLLQSQMLVIKNAKKNLFGKDVKSTNKNNNSLAVQNREDRLQVQCLLPGQPMM